MPIEMYLKLDGVNGGSKDHSHEGWADVTSWGWGMVSNRNAAQVSGNDMTSFREITITKPIGADSAAIMLLYAQGKLIQHADLNIIPAVAKREVKQKYLSLRMEDVLVKSIVVGGSSSENFFNEKIILIFNKISFEYNSFVSSNPQGLSEKSVNYNFAWDILNNKEWEAGLC